MSMNTMLIVMDSCINVKIVVIWVRVTIHIEFVYEK